MSEDYVIELLDSLWQNKYEEFCQWIKKKDFTVIEHRRPKDAIYHSVWEENGKKIYAYDIHKDYKRGGNKEGTNSCERCGKDCVTKYKEDGRIKSISCPDCSGPHASGDYSYLCGCDYCRCCQ